MTDRPKRTSKKDKPRAADLDERFVLDGDPEDALKRLLTADRQDDDHGDDAA